MKDFQEKTGKRLEEKWGRQERQKNDGESQGAWRQAEGFGAHLAGPAEPLALLCDGIWHK